MTKHTAGPWRVQECTNFSGTLVAYVRSAAGVQLFQSRHCDKDYTKEECNADAHLIAAAPELLEALEELTQYALCIDWFKKDPSPCGACKLCRAKAAIAKAKGE